MINFTSGLIKVGKGYINPVCVARFKEYGANGTYVEHTDGKHDAFSVPVENFADAMIEAGKTGNIIDISA